jgi:hypothetical protein
MAKKKWNGMSIKGALAILHPEGNTLDDLTTAFRNAQKKWHPDLNGGKEDCLRMSQAINESYETLKRKIGEWEVSWGPSKAETTGDKELFTEMMELYNSIKHLPGIDIFRQGIYVCVAGNTRPIKDYFKRAGMQWHGRDKEWQWHPEWYQPPSYKGYRGWSKSQKINTYGRVRLDNQPLTALG